MAVATTNGQRTAPTAKAKEIDYGQMLDEILSSNASQVASHIRTVLGSAEAKAKLESILPPSLQGAVDRLIAVAQMTVNTRPELGKCTTPSIIKCVYQAAKAGFALDGELAYAVPFNNKKKDANGKEFWETEATLIISYRGLVAAARRTKVIRDCWAHVICENDEFEFSEENGIQRYKFRPALESRGPIIGAFAVASLEFGYRIEVMGKAELDKIRNVSKGKNSPAWANWESEMHRKTPVRRLLKWYAEDPFMQAALSASDAIDELDATPIASPKDRVATLLAPREANEDLRAMERLEPVAEHHGAPVEGEVTPEMAVIELKEMLRDYCGDDTKLIGQALKEGFGAQVRSTEQVTRLTLDQVIEGTVKAKAYLDSLPSA